MSPLQFTADTFSLAGKEFILDRGGCPVSRVSGFHTKAGLEGKNRRARVFQLAGLKVSFSGQTKSLRCAHHELILKLSELKHLGSCFHCSFAPRSDPSGFGCG